MWSAPHEEGPGKKRSAREGWVGGRGFAQPRGSEIHAGDMEKRIAREGLVGEEALPNLGAPRFTLEIRSRCASQASECQWRMFKLPHSMVVRCHAFPYTIRTIEFWCESCKMASLTHVVVSCAKHLESQHVPSYHAVADPCRITSCQVARLYRTWARHTSQRAALPCR